MVSLLVSLVLNGLLFFTFSVIASKRVSVALQPEPETPTEQVVSIMVMPEPGVAGEAQARPVVPVPPRPDQFARTSEDQASARPEKPAFIGERDTEATSDRAPDPTAEAMPSQKGIDPVRSEVETTESRYEDGELGDSGKGKPAEPVAESAPPAPGLPSPESPPAVETPANPDSKPAPESMPAAAREQLAQGPNPVDIPVQADPNNDQPKPTPSGRATEAELPKPPTPLKETAQEKPKETAVAEKAPGFKGYQRKTQIRGSISRTGKSALAVENSAMGRYQATLSRAVELEWQRNCVRYRDYITPGFLTVRFVVEQNGKVRSTGFVGAMQTNEIQKGFTLNAIRQAAIPAMPADLKKELGSEPLELIFNFYF